LLNAGDLDLTFGSGGRMVSDQPIYLEDMAVQGDGKILLTGGGLYDVGPVVRLNVDGAVDKTFGKSGIAYSGFSEYLAGGSALAIGPGGKIAVSGWAGPYVTSDPQSNEGTITVFNSNGTLDTSVNKPYQTGIIEDTRVPQGFLDVIFQGSKLLAVGQKLLRYNADGSSDPSFGGGDGQVDVDGIKLLLDSGGRIVVLGKTALYRFKADGSLDLSFDGDGVVANIHGSDVGLDSQGRIVVAGADGKNAQVARYLANGSIDRSFGVAGFANAKGDHLLVTGNHIFVGGTVGGTPRASENIAITALTYAGQVDKSFGGGGTVVTDINQQSDELQALALQSGKLLAGVRSEVHATSIPYTDEHPAVVRYLLSGSSAAPPSGIQKPYASLPELMPDVIQFENFDFGGEGTAYHDTDAANLGGAYRAKEAVDIQPTADSAGPGYTVGFVKAGEWLEYTVNVPEQTAQTSGTYDIDFRVSSLRAGGKFHVEVDGKNVTGSIAAPQTGDWNKYTTITKKGVPIAGGTHVLRVAFESNGSLGYVGNFNFMKLNTVLAQQRPYLQAFPYKSNMNVPASAFDYGGEGIAYHDTEAKNIGGATRPNEGVDIENNKSTSNQDDVGWTRPGEWLEYTMDLVETKPYNLRFTVASLTGGGSFSVWSDGKKLTSFDMPNTGNWQYYTEIVKSGIVVAPGRHVIRVQMDTPGPQGIVGNFADFGFWTVY
jgi:uncharacterized delta-60 repeat protein